MKNTLKPLPSFEVGTPRTDAQSQLDANRYHGHSRDYVSLKIFTEQLERELAELIRDKERLDWLIDNAIMPHQHR
jgi:hypothetical protein